MDSIQWEKFDDNGYLKTSKSHYIDDSNRLLSYGAKTLCGVTVPSRNEADSSGGMFVDCKRCKKALAKLEKSPC